MVKVRELRLVVTVEDFEDAAAFYRDVLGMPEREVVSSPGGRVMILDAGQATLELADVSHATYIDQVEVGTRVAGHIRVALQVDEVDACTDRARMAGAVVIAEPTHTPWGSRNARLSAPGGLQLTLFGD
jgi:lactoylglutathione lyase